jgi:Carboxypeptidase regulatory-like domain
MSPDARTPPPRPLTLTGAVRDAQGAPIAAATISIAGATGTSTTSGDFQLTGVSEGTGLVSVTASGFRSRVVPAQIADEAPPLVVHLPPADGIELVFTGDLALEDGRVPGDLVGFIANLAAVTRTADVVVPNVEGVVGGGAEAHPTQPFPIAMPEGAAAALASLGRGAGPVSRLRMAMASLLAVSCGGPTAPTYSATWTLAGALAFARAADDVTGGRVTCTVADDLEGSFDGTPFLTLSFISGVSAGAGIHLVAPGWRGVGAAEPKTILVYDGADLVTCNSAGPRCFGLGGGTCTVTIDAWSTEEVLFGGAHAGTGSGSFSCQGLKNENDNDEGQTLDVQGGRFVCRASDWTGR